MTTPELPPLTDLPPHVRLQKIVEAFVASHQGLEQAMNFVYMHGDDYGLDLEAVCELVAEDEQRRVLTEISERGLAAFREARWVTRYTTAPEGYDGFGTVQVGTVVRGARTYRKVLIDPAHLSWQDLRYRSGAHASFSKEQDLV